MKILVACEFSGTVRQAFEDRGHDAWSCDLLPSESATPKHYQTDVMEVLSLDWDLMIAHPPCTYLTNAGVRWLYINGKGKVIDEERWRNMELATDFFNALLNTNIPKICLENPIMHKYAKERIEIPYSQIIQPWQFGHAETKATCLWLKGIPQLTPTDIIQPDYEKFPRRVQVERKSGKIKQNRGSGFATRIIGGSGGYDPRIHHASPGPDRWKERSRTYQGIADSMAEQWGNL